METKVYRVCGIRLSDGLYGNASRDYSTPEEAWMRAQADGIDPEWVESKSYVVWLEEPYTPPSDAIYVDLYYLYQKGILGD